MPLRSKMSALIGVAALAGIVFAMTAWSSHGDYKVLYANLPTRTAAPSSPSSRR